MSRGSGRADSGVDQSYKNETHRTSSGKSIRVLLPGLTHVEDRGSSRTTSVKTTGKLKESQRLQNNVRIDSTDVLLDYDEAQRSLSSHQAVAARVIQRTWIAYRDKQLFRLLKHSVCAAESCMSHDILRLIAPSEAELVKDKSVKAKVKLRFGGSEFPPLVFFKVFLTSSARSNVTFISGRKMIRPASDAARHACDIMGQRKYYEQVIEDTIDHHMYRIADEIDIATRKDSIQYSRLLDELPANKGGRDNTWRRLTNKALPRFTIFRNIFDYVYSGKLTPAVAENMASLLARPITTDIHKQHLDIISRIRTPQPPTCTPRSHGTPGQSGRRSQRARQRAKQMKAQYSVIPDPTSVQLTDGRPGSLEKEILDIRETIGDRADDYGDTYGDTGSEEEEWNDSDAQHLYQWTQTLDIDGVMDTPRVS